ncbi:hypothetical protein P9112_011545 [Eukaryota sp. TZLM1-RC]
MFQEKMKLKQLSSKETDLRKHRLKQHLLEDQIQKKAIQICQLSLEKESLVAELEKVKDKCDSYQQELVAMNNIRSQLSHFQDEVSNLNRSLLDKLMKLSN